MEEDALEDTKGRTCPLHAAKKTKERSVLKGSAVSKLINVNETQSKTETVQLG